MKYVEKICHYYNYGNAISVVLILYLYFLTIMRWLQTSDIISLNRSLPDFVNYLNVQIKCTQSESIIKFKVFSLCSAAT